MAQVTLIPGDGIGAEITDSVKEIFEHVNAPIEWEQYNVSGMSTAGEDLFRQAMDSLKRNRVGLKGRFNASCARFPGEQLTGLRFCRYSVHPDLPGWTCVMECGHAPTTRHLRVGCPLQVPSWLPHASFRRRLRYHP